jgi:glycosyltransferase involved in cell wall biosynthesis
MGRFAERIARWIVDAGWSVKIIGSRVPGHLRADCEVVSVPSWASLPAVPQHLAWSAGARMALRTVDVDLVHVHSPLLAGSAHLLTCHFLAQPAFEAGVRNQRRGLEGSLRRLQDSTERRLDHRAYRRLPDRLHLSFVSEFLRDEFRRCYGEPNSGYVISPPAPPWRPASPAQRSAARDRWEVPADKLVAGYLGGDNPRKGFEHVESLQGADDIHVLVAGHGSQRLRWRGRPGLGVVDPDELHAACDVVVAPSLFDSAPVAVLQALARGVPAVVTPTTGWAPAIERSEAGVVWRPGQAIADAVRRAAEAATEACRELTEEFGEARQRAVVLRAYREILDLQGG